MPAGRENRVGMDREPVAGITTPAETLPAEHPRAEPLAALAAAPHDPAANRQAGYQLGQEGRWKEALVCWERVVAAEPDDLDGWYFVGLAASHTGDKDRAREALARLLAANPAEPKLQARLANLLRCAAKASEAVPWARRALKGLSEPEWRSWAIDVLHYCYVELGDQAARLQLHQELARAEPENPDHLHHLAHAYSDQGDHTAALETAERLIQLAPEASESWHRYYFVAREAGDRQAARRALKKSLALEDTADARADLASELGRLGEHRAAVEQGEAALARGLSPERRAWLHDILACCYGELDDEEASLRHARAAVDLDPNDSTSLYNLGRSLFVRRDYAEALPHLERAVALEPEYHKAWKLLGGTAARLGDNVRAREAYERALTLEDDTETRARLAGVLKRLDEYGAAIEQGERALREGETELAAWLHGILGFCYLEIGDYATMLAHAEQWVSLAPEEPMAWSALATAAEELGDYRRASEATQRCVTLTPDDIFRRQQLAWLLQRNEEFRPAIEQHQHALELTDDPATRSWAYAGMARCHA